MKEGADRFDDGVEQEAINLAVRIRVLVHDTNRSISLLTLLGKKKMMFYDSAPPINTSNLLSETPLLLIRFNREEGGSYRARLDALGDKAPNRGVPFSKWWNKSVILVIPNDRFSRRDLVMTVANKAGGAHVDPELPSAFANVAKFNSVGWKSMIDGFEDDPTNSPVSASIRQITHEMLRSLSVEYPNLVGTLPRGPADHPGIGHP